MRAGLIPNLEAGFLVQDRDLWEIATSKPGDAPPYNLAASLVSLSGLGESAESIEKLLESLDTRDDLPILQHALMRTWQVWAENDGKGVIDLDHYEQAGTLKNALRLHADEALKNLKKDDRVIAERMFQALTETDASNRRIRRPAHLHQIAAICGQDVSPEKVLSLIKRFNADNRNFLVLSTRTPSDDPLIDISHESLIRQWKTLVDWVDREAESARIYQRLSQSANLYAQGKAGLYKETDLQVALDWQRQQQPNTEWAARYDSNFSRAMDFLDQSVKKQRTNKMFIISLLACVYASLYTWLVIATTDDVSMATNSTSLPIIGTQMPVNLVYLVSPLIMISIYAWFLLHLQRLVLILSSQPKALKGGKFLMAWLEKAGMHALAWITIPAVFIGLWLHYLLRRDWVITGFHIVFITLAVFMAFLFHRSSKPGEPGTMDSSRQVKKAGIACALLVALVVWLLSLGVFEGTPERYFTRHGDYYGFVPWLFHEVGYDVFFDFNAKLNEVVQQQLGRSHPELFTPPPDTWFDMTTPYNVHRKDICR